MSSLECIVTTSSLAVFILTIFIIFQFQLTQDNFNNKKPCSLPSHPSSGWWSIKLSIHDKMVNSHVPTGTTLTYSCKETYIIQGPKKSICIKGTWFPSPPKCSSKCLQCRVVHVKIKSPPRCKRNQQYTSSLDEMCIVGCLQAQYFQNKKKTIETCPSMHSTSMIRIQCKYKNEILKNCNHPLEYTEVKFICPPFYKDERKINLKAICINGSWSNMIPQCVPVCGQRQAHNVEPLIINGTETQKHEFPWQAAILKKSDFICGGTLLHERLILTAAHCVYYEHQPLQADIFQVVVGNHMRNYSIDSQAQISTVVEIIGFENYQGAAGRYSNDIALIVTKETFKLSYFVQPICIDWTLQFTDTISTVGTVSGWGDTLEDRNFAINLRSVDVPIISREKCLQDVEKTLKSALNYISEDKICAGYINKSKSVCRGDSGSGLIVNNANKYFILGVVSISLRGNSEFGGCNSQFYSFYTNVSHYLENFIWENYAKYKPYRFPMFYENDWKEVINESSTSTTSPKPTTPQKHIPKGSCVFPQHPKFGRLEIYNDFVGESLQTGAILKVSCNNNYKLDGDKMLACENGVWSSPVGVCLKMCSSLNHTNMQVSCYYKIAKLENCLEPVEGTSAKYYCDPFYEDLKLMEHPLYCMDGEWTPSSPICAPKCGERAPEGPTFEELNIQRRDFPWMVSIYERKNFSHICSGTLLSEKIIITSADCFKHKNKDQLVVVGGNYFKEYHRFANSSQTQFSNIKQITVIRDVAFIFIEKLFKLALVVQPICIDWSNKFNKQIFQTWIGDWTTSNSSATPVTLRTTLVPDTDCMRAFPDQFMNMTTNKKCFSYNSENGFCFNNTGGGVFFDYRNRFYLHGVIEKVSSCNCTTLYNLIYNNGFLLNLKMDSLL